MIVTIWSETDHIHAVYFRVSSLILSFDLGLSSRLPTFFLGFLLCYKYFLKHSIAISHAVIKPNSSFSATVVPPRYMVNTFKATDSSEGPSVPAGHYTHQKGPPTYMVNTFKATDSSEGPSDSLILLCLLGITPTKKGPPTTDVTTIAPGQVAH